MLPCKFFEVPRIFSSLASVSQRERVKCLYLCHLRSVDGVMGQNGLPPLPSSDHSVGLWLELTFSQFHVCNYHLNRKLFH